MKKFICLLVLGFVLIAGVAFAEEKKEELQITVGVKTWYNKWSEKFDTEYGSGKDRFVTRKSDYVLAVGPAISFKKGPYFGGISYLQAASDYKFDLTYRTSDTERTHYVESTSRYDIDALVGYYFHPRVGGFAGYKYAHYKEIIDKDILDNSGNITSRRSNTESLNLHGPVIGLTANYPIGSTGLTPFLTVSYLWVRSVNEDNPVNSANQYGPSAELGIGYTIKKFTFTAAYKQQTYYFDNETGYIKFGGPIFSVNYTF